LEKYSILGSFYGYAGFDFKKQVPNRIEMIGLGKFSICKEIGYLGLTEYIEGKLVRKGLP